MKTNETPHYDSSFNSTGCCARFNPEGWDGQELHFTDKPFVRAMTRSLAYVPLNMSGVFGRVSEAIEDAGAFAMDQYLVMSRDLSPFSGEHLFAVTGPVPGEETRLVSGDFLTGVFEGPYRKVREWHTRMLAAARAKGREAKDVWFFYATCPKCAQAYGKNYVVGLAELD